MKRKPLPEKIKDSPFGLMNRSASTPPRPYDITFGEEAPAVITDIPAYPLPDERTCLLSFAEGEDFSGGVCVIHTENGTPVGMWRNSSEYRNVMWHSPVRDFSEWTHIEFSMYAHTANGAIFTFEIRGPWTKNPEPPHFRLPIRLNWSGWRHFTVCLDTLDPAWGGDIHDIHFIGLHATGWENDAYAYPATYVCLTDVYLTRRQGLYAPDPAAVTPYVLESLRARWQDTLVAPMSLRSAYPSVDEQVRRLSPHGKGFYEKMNKTPGAEYLWDDVRDTRDNVQIQINMERLFYMARAWAAQDTETYHDEDLLAAIKFGLEWIWQNAYGDILLTIGTPGNWWQWTIGIPWAEVKCLLLIRETLSQEEIRHYLSYADKRCRYPFMTNANRTWIAYVSILASLLENDVPRLIECIRRMQTVFGYTDRSDGFYYDGSFIMHANKSYIGGYGSNYLLQLSDFFYILADSPLALPEEYARMTMTQFFNTHVPMIDRGVFAKACKGRGVLDNGLAVGVLTSMLKLVPVTTEEEKNKLYAFIRYCFDTNPVFASEFEKRLEPVTAPYFSELMAAKSAEPPVFARVFNGMDRAMKQTGKWSACLAYNTTRTGRYESINGQNECGWYQAEGSLAVTCGDPFHYDGTFYRETDPYRFPGTTVTAAPRVDGCVVFLPSGTYSFGGGVDDTEYAFVGLHQGYRAFNFPWPYDFKSDLDLYKSWFFFGDGILCMAAGVNCTDGEEVYTTVDQRRLTEESVVTADGKPVPLTSRDRSFTARSVYASDFGGYVFPEETKLWSRRRVGEKASWFELMLRHGKTPKNESFSYILLPGADEAKIAEYEKNPPVQILSNTPSLMAVSHKSGVRAYSFFEAGTFDGITVSVPCVVMVRETSAGKVFTVSDPTHRRASVAVTIDGASEAIPAGGDRSVVRDDLFTAVSSVRDGNALVVTVDTNGAVGVPRSFTVR